MDISPQSADFEPTEHLLNKPNTPNMWRKLFGTLFHHDAITGVIKSETTAGVHEAVFKAKWISIEF